MALTYAVELLMCALYIDNYYGKGVAHVPLFVERDHILRAEREPLTKKIM